MISFDLKCSFDIRIAKGKVHYNVKNVVLLFRFYVVIFLSTTSLYHNIYFAEESTPKKKYEATRQIVDAGNRESPATLYSFDHNHEVDDIMNIINCCS